MQPNQPSIQVSRREVRDNLIRFREAALNEGHFAERHHSYPILVNPHTGDMSFADRTGPLQQWQRAQLQVWEKTRGHWEALMDDTLKGLEPIAWNVLRETIEALNEWLAQQKTMDVALATLPNVHVVQSHGHIENLPGWLGNMDRLKAEKLLEGAPKGTYILREGDEDTRAVAFHLAQENKMKVHAYVCTVVESGHKISDLLVLHTPQGWTLYQDNPDLFDSQYAYCPSPQGMILLLHPRIKKAFRTIKR